MPRPTRIEADSPPDLPAMAISAEKVCYVILKAREFDAKDVVTEADYLQEGLSPLGRSCDEFEL